MAPTKGTKGDGRDWSEKSLQRPRKARIGQSRSELCRIAGCWRGDSSDRVGRRHDVDHAPGHPCRGRSEYAAIRRARPRARRRRPLPREDFPFDHECIDRFDERHTQAPHRGEIGTTILAGPPSGEAGLSARTAASSCYPLPKEDQAFRERPNRCGRCARHLRLTNDRRFKFGDQLSVPHEHRARRPSS